MPTEPTFMVKISLGSNEEQQLLIRTKDDISNGIHVGMYKCVCSLFWLYAVIVYLVWPFKKITYCSCQLTRTKMTGLPPISIKNKEVVRFPGYIWERNCNTFDSYYDSAKCQYIDIYVWRIEIHIIAIIFLEKMQ